MANNILTKLFGNYSKRELKRVQPLVDAVLKLEDKYKAMSEEDYKAKITEIGNSVNDLMPEVTAAQAKASTDPQAAMKELTATVNKMKPLYTELAGLKAPEKFADAQTKIKNGAEASVELLDLTLEMMELALDPAKASEATAKMTELQEKMTGFTDKAAELTEGLTEVMGA